MESTALVLSDTEIVNPIGGEILDISTVDGMVEAYQQLGQIKRAVYVAEDVIKTAMAAKATEGGKTRRIAGDEHQAVLTMPSDKWNNAALKQLWERFPDLREKYLRITEVAPNMTEVKKLEGTTCEGELFKFRALLLAAREPASGQPSIKIER